MSNTVYTCSLFLLSVVDFSSVEVFCAKFLVSKSASLFVFSALLVSLSAASSPIAFLKPFTDAPKSEPSVRSLFVPNNKTTRTAMMSNCQMLIPPVLCSSTIFGVILNNSAHYIQRIQFSGISNSSFNLLKDKL
jgi:hypothetical protein